MAEAWETWVAAFAAVIAVCSQYLQNPPKRAEALSPPDVPDWAVGRPGELRKIVKALTRRDGGTILLHGMGGVGKSMLAKMAYSEKRVKIRFTEQIHFVPIGPNTDSPEGIAGKVNDLLNRISGETFSFTDPDQARGLLDKKLSSGPRKLVVLDDVWRADQLAPFVGGGKKCVLLVTTRNPNLAKELDTPLSGRLTKVSVSQMSPGQARKVLTASSRETKGEKEPAILPVINQDIESGLLKVADGWPLLLRLVNRYLHLLADMSSGGFQYGAQELLEKLNEEGPSAIDNLGIEDEDKSDAVDPLPRAKAVKLTIAASTDLLKPGEKSRRFSELAVFAEGEIIPLALVGALWKATGAQDNSQSLMLCKELEDLGLITLSPENAGNRGVRIHGIIRDHLLNQFTGQEMARIGGMMLDEIARRKGFPVLASLNPTQSTPERAWWQLSDDDHYLWGHLIGQLIAADRKQEAEVLACDLRWAEARLLRFGPAAPAADLGMVGSDRASRLRALLDRSSHLLTPAIPPASVLDILHSCVAADPEWGPASSVLRDAYHRPRLLTRWQPPALEDPALRRTLALTYATGKVRTSTVAPQGNWIAVAGDDGIVQIWDSEKGGLLRTVVGQLGEHELVTGLVVAPDGSWIAASLYEEAWVWNPDTGQRIHTFLGNWGQYVQGLVVAPDGRWLAAGLDHEVRIWELRHLSSNSAASLSEWSSRIWWRFRGMADGLLWDWRGWHGYAPGTWSASIDLDGCNGFVNVMAVSPDYRWLAAGFHGEVRVWSPATWAETSTFNTNDGQVTGLAFASDGSWLATGTYGGEVQIWDSDTWKEIRSLPGSGIGVRTVAFDSASNRLAIGGKKGEVQVWDSTSWSKVHSFICNGGEVSVITFLPGNSYLVTADGRAVRIWDHTAISEGFSPTFSSASFPMNAVAVDPQGGWLASGTKNGKVQIWNPGTGNEVRTITPNGEVNEIYAVTVASNGSWVAAGDGNFKIRIWSAITWEVIHAFTGASRVHAVAFSPDARLIAAGESNLVRVWETGTWGKYRTLEFPDNATVYAVDFSSDSNRIAAGGDHGIVKIWDLSTEDKLRTLGDNGNCVRAVAFSPKDHLFAAGDKSGKIRIWDLSTDSEPSTLIEIGSEVNAVAFSPGGRWLATADGEGEVRIWDPGTGQQHAQMRVEAALTSCAWLGESAVAACGQAGIYLFDYLSDSMPIVD